MDFSLVFTFDHACMCLLLKWSCLKVNSKQFSSPEPKAHKVSFYYGIDLVSVHVFVCPQLNISETSRPIVFKFYLNHYMGWGKVAVDFRTEFLYPWRHIAPIFLSCV